MIGLTISHYRITAKLGSGGMGEVYEAEDTELRRKVALKVLPEELASDPERLERFKREARAVAALNHPNIVTLHSVEEADGHHFLTMELVDGDSLDQLVPDGGLTLDRLFELAIPIADALAAAHEKGVIHRDLKPANVMVGRDGRVKIVDFGLAKLWEAEPGSEETALETEGLTKEGVAMGTAPYMSPEQLQGVEVDHRSDLFSLGILIFEMTTGRRPFKGKSSIELASSILKDSPDSVTDLREGVPRHLGRIIRHCLEKDPELRYQSAKDVRNELAGLEEEVKSGEVPLSTGAQPIMPAHDSAALPVPATSSGRPGWLIPVLVAVVALIAILGWMMNRQDEPQAAEMQETAAAPVVESGLTKIVVLPFENLGPAEDEYFAAGMTEEISARLASVSDLGVISRSSAVQYDRTGKTLKQVGEDLGVGYVLEGTVRWAKSPDGTSRVRITPQLTQVADDTQLWAESYDRTIEDIFKVQTEVADAVLQSLDLRLLAAGSEPDAGAPTENLEAYNLYLKAKNLDEQIAIGLEQEGRFEILSLLEQAVELDPLFALAWAEISEQHAQLYFNGEDRTEERLESALQAVEKSLEIDPDLPQAHVALGHYYYWGPRDYEKALGEFAIAEESLPNNPDLMASIAYIRRRQGHFEEAATRLEKAVELNPRSVTQARALGTTYMSLGRYADADRVLTAAIELSPEAVGPAIYGAHNWFLWKGDGKGALERFEPLLDLGIEVLKFNQVNFLMGDRDFDGALQVLETMDEPLYPNQFAANPPSLGKALALKALGRTAEAQAAAETAVEILEPQVLANPNDPRMHGALGQAYALLGRDQEARRESERAVKLQPYELDAFEGVGRLSELATTYSILEDAEKTLEAADQILTTNKIWLSVPVMEVIPQFDFLRDHPGYKELIRKHS
jgi:serine/threonine protein kinase/TolB-like protein/Flp pilus assembly protein TadD